MQMRMLRAEECYTAGISLKSSLLHFQQVVKFLMREFCVRFSVSESNFDCYNYILFDFVIGLLC